MDLRVIIFLDKILCQMKLGIASSNLQINALPKKYFRGNKKNLNFKEIMSRLEGKGDFVVVEYFKVCYA